MEYSNIALFVECWNTDFMNSKFKSIYEQYWHERIRKSMDDNKCGGKPNEIFDTASPVLKGGESILDVGCGDGYFFLNIKERFRKIYGAEISKEAALVAQKQGALLTLMDLNLSLSYKNNTFDAVACLEVIEHLLDPCLLLAEIHRVLRPKGQLILTTPNIRCFSNLYKLILKGTFPHTSPDTFVWGGGHLHFFTRKDISDLLKIAGFKRTEFFINQDQFLMSKKRKLIRSLFGEKAFGEWLCGSITISTYKES